MTGLTPYLRLVCAFAGAIGGANIVAAMCFGDVSRLTPAQALIGLMMGFGSLGSSLFLLADIVNGWPGDLGGPRRIRR